MELLIDPPWYLPACLIAVGLGLFIWGNNRLRAREKRIGIGIILATLAMMTVAYFVESDSEIVARQTRELAQAVVARDKSAIGAALSHDAIAYGWDRQDIIDGAVCYADKSGLTGQRILSLRVEREGIKLVSYLTLWSQHSGKGDYGIVDLNSTWRLQWVKENGAWLANEIVPLQIGPMPQSALEDRYLSRPVPSR